MFIIKKSGYTEITESVTETLMDIALRNRGRNSIDCEYAVDAEPERYKVTESGLVAKTDDELVADGLMTAAELTAKKDATTAAIRRAAFVAESDPLFFKQQRGEVPAGTWEAKVAEIRARSPEA